MELKLWDVMLASSSMAREILTFLCGPSGLEICSSVSQRGPFKASISIKTSAYGQVMVFSATLGDTPFLGRLRWQEIIWAGEVCNI